MILLDTNIVIHLFNGHHGIAGKLDEYSPHEVSVSFVTLGELIFGALRSKKSQQNLLKVMQFTKQVSVLHSTAEVASLYGEFKNRSHKSGCFPGDNDLWIAASAVAGNAMLVTANLRHFNWIADLESENWLS